MNATGLRLRVSSFLADPWLVGSAAWGFAEATLFFVVPDVIVGWIALRSPRRFWGPGLAASLAAVAGGLLVYALPGWFQPAFLHVPLITQALLDEVARLVGSQGWWALFSGPWSGLPYKAYAAEYGSRHSGAFALAVLTPLARLERLLPVALAWSLVGRWRWLAARPRLQAAGYAAFWVAVYVAYAVSMRAKYGGA